MSRGPHTAGALPVLLALASVWGASFLFIKVAVEEISPIEVTAGRLFFGAVAILGYMWVRRVRFTAGPMIIAQVMALAVIANIAPFFLIAWGEEHIDSGLASVLNSTMPIFTAVIAAALLSEERFTIARLVGLLLGFAGVVVLTEGKITNVTDANVLGQLAVIGAAACYGLGSVISRQLLRSVGPLELSALQVALGAVIAAPLVAVFAGAPKYGDLSLGAALSLLVLGVMGTGFGYIAYLWLIEVTGSVRASLVTYLVPIVGLILGWLVLDERIGLNILLGATLIIIGVISVMRGQLPARQRRVRQEPAPAAVE
jgi:drug/metabolite transporter (DMT)-like permease